MCIYLLIFVLAKAVLSHYIADTSSNQLISSIYVSGSFQ